LQRSTNDTTVDELLAAPVTTLICCHALKKVPRGQSSTTAVSILIPTLLEYTFIIAWIWGWIKTYKAKTGGMNIHLPAILG
jgi:hypothetical protein